MNKIHVVLAEHDATVLEVLKDFILRDEELDLIGCAENGMEAWSLIRDMEPDVVVTELLMPYMDGFALLDRISKYAELSKKPKIIVTSTMSNEAIVRESFELGVDYFIIKPYDVHSVTKRIKQVCTEATVQSGITEISLDTETVIANYLIGLGIPVSLKGYRYIMTAIEEVVKDSSMIYGITKILYPLIAKKHNSTPARVEKSIRHAIEVAWARNNEDTIKKYIGNEVDINEKRPTNSEFIALLAQKIKHIA